MPHLTDTHTHLYDVQFDPDRLEMVNRAISRDVKHLLLPNVDLSTIDGMLELCKQFPENVFPMMGLHPCNVSEDWENEMQLIEEYLRHSHYLAVGEIGLDLYWDKSTFDRQRSAFVYQMMLAKELHLPVSIHSRDATAECIALIEQHQLFTGGVFHCWGGTLPQAQKVIEMGFYLGIGGVLTFKNAEVSTILKDISLDHLVLETDAPYLAPMPYRGKRNESSYIVEVATKLAEIKNVTLAEVAEKTSANAEDIFKIQHYINTR